MKILLVTPRYSENYRDNILGLHKMVRWERAHRAKLMTFYFSGEMH